MEIKDEEIISTVTIAEVMTGFYMAGDKNKAITVKRLLNDLTLNSFKIVPVTFEIADLAAKLRAEKGGRLPDALIAATAINQSAKIIYTQDKDMPRFNQNIKISELP